MNNTMKKVISIVICASLLTGTIGAGVYSIASARSEQSAAPKAVKAEIKPEKSASVQKDETVYVLAGADGIAKKIIVSDWLKNAAGLNISDISSLSDIENVKGDEEFVVGADGNITWQTTRDIYYQGTSTEQLPVEMKITYTLDGIEMKPENMVGKSGKVTIRFDYMNNTAQSVKIGKKTETICVPFAMMTGMLLDDEVFRNVEITNGKLINDGSRMIVAGVAFPGLQSSLGIDEDVLEIPDFIEITADVTDFEMGMTATIATNEVFNNIDADGIDVDSIGENLSEMTDGMAQLTDGSDQLYDGLCELLDKSGELVSGVKKLSDGAKQLSNGTKELSSGAAELSSGASELNSGLNTLTQNSSALNDGAEQVFNSLLDTASLQIKASGLDVPKLTIENYGSVLDRTIASLDENNVYSQALAQVTDAVNSQKELIRTQVEAAVRQQVTEQVRAGVVQQMKAQGMTDEMLAAPEFQAQIEALTEANVQQQMTSPTVKATVDEQTELQIKKLISENMASDDVQGKLAAASAGAKSLIGLKAQLDSYNTFYLGLKAYTNGVSQAADGAAKISSGASALKSGADKLNSGAGSLSSGITQLEQGTPALIDGIKQLKDGSKQLSDGIKKFDEEAVQKLVSAYDGDFSALADRLKAVQDASKSYKAYAGIPDDMDGNVKFFFRTDAVG